MVLRSEASARFEKGVDPNRVHVAAMNVQLHLMAKYAGGEVLEGTVEADTLTVRTSSCLVTAEKINRVLGTDIDC